MKGLCCGALASSALCFSLFAASSRTRCGFFPDQCFFSVATFFRSATPHSASYNSFHGRCAHTLAHKLSGIMANVYDYSGIMQSSKRLHHTTFGTWHCTTTYNSILVPHTIWFSVKCSGRVVVVVVVYNLARGTSLNVAESHFCLPARKCAWTTLRTHTNSRGVIQYHVPRVAQCRYNVTAHTHGHSELLQLPCSCAAQS